MGPLSGLRCFQTSGQSEMVRTDHGCSKECSGIEKRTGDQKLTAIVQNVV